MRFGYEKREKILNARCHILRYIVLPHIIRLSIYGLEQLENPCSNIAYKNILTTNLGVDKMEVGGLGW